MSDSAKDLLDDYFSRYHPKVARDQQKHKDSKKASVFTKMKQKLASWWDDLFNSDDGVSDQKDTDFIASAKLLRQKCEADDRMSAKALHLVATKFADIALGDDNQVIKDMLIGIIEDRE